MFYGTFWCPACDAQRQLFGMPAWQSEPRFPNTKAFEGPVWRGTGGGSTYIPKMVLICITFNIDLSQMYRYKYTLSIKSFFVIVGHTGNIGKINKESYLVHQTACLGYFLRCWECGHFCSGSHPFHWWPIDFFWKHT